MHEPDVEMHEQNDPMEHAIGEVEARESDYLHEPEVEDGATPSPMNPEMRRDQIPESS